MCYLSKLMCVRKYNNQCTFFSIECYVKPCLLPQTTAVSSQGTISAVQALHDALSGQITKTTSSPGLGSSPQTSATIHRTLPQIRSQAEGSPLSVQSITSATQALASIQQILANRISQSSSMQSSPPHASLTPSLAHLMGEQAVALLNGGASKQTPPNIKSLPVQGTNVSSDTNSVVCAVTPGLSSMPLLFTFIVLCTMYPSLSNTLFI